MQVYQFARSAAEEEQLVTIGDLRQRIRRIADACCKYDNHEASVCPTALGKDQVNAPREAAAVTPLEVQMSAVVVAGKNDISQTCQTACQNAALEEGDGIRRFAILACLRDLEVQKDKVCLRTMPQSSTYVCSLSALGKNEQSWNSDVTSPICLLDCGCTSHDWLLLVQMRRECKRLSRQRAELIASKKPANTLGFASSLGALRYTQYKQKGSVETWGAGYKVGHL